MLSKVKRYDFELVDDRDALGVKVVKHHEGKFVHHTDYAALEARLADDKLAFDHAQEVVGKLEAQLAGKWTNVKERLPKQAEGSAYSDKVLVRTRKGNVWLAEAVFYQKIFAEWHLVYPAGYVNDDYLTNDPVTYWQPSPAGPQEKHNAE